MDRYDGTFELLDPSLIVIDHKYQRPEKWDLIAKISGEPEWAAFGVVLCSKRKLPNKGALYYCLDGQQRLQGVLTSAVPPTTVPVLWFPVGSQIEEARLFSIVNEQRKAVNALEKYHSHMTMQDPRYLQITSAVERAGHTIGHSGERTIGAMEGLQSIYNKTGEQGVFVCVSAIGIAWPDDKMGRSTWILRALGDILADAQSNGGMSVAKLGGSLSKTTPGRILRKAEELRFEMGGSKRENVRRAFKTLAKI